MECSTQRAPPQYDKGNDQEQSRSEMPAQASTGHTCLLLSLRLIAKRQALVRKVGYGTRRKQRSAVSHEPHGES